jgi:hypothetical protein
MSAAYERNAHLRRIGDQLHEDTQVDHRSEAAAQRDLQVRELSVGGFASSFAQAAWKAS